MVKLSLLYSEDVARMHLHSRPNIEANVFMIAKRLRKETTVWLSACTPPETILGIVLAEFSAESIHGYLVNIAETLLRRLKPLLASDDRETRIEASYALIDFASILASTSSQERCFSARDAFVRAMVELETQVAFDVAS